MTKPENPASHLRLYVPDALTESAQITLNKNQHHYLARVMRRTISDKLTLFNGKDGEWQARIISQDKETVTRVESQLRKQEHKPDIWLLFAPVKNAKPEWIVDKATELGASKIIPTLTRHTIVRKIHDARLQAHAIEAAEQTERMTVPEITTLSPLPKLLEQWPEDRPLLFCDESGNGEPIGKALQKQSTPLAIIIGPEGGFAEEEHQLLQNHKQTQPVTLGPRILKADTAAISALALVQSHCGDWQNKPDFRT